MRARDAWVVPTVAGVPRYDKPILVYWLLRASRAALGDMPAADRLPSSLAAALTVGLVAWWARRRWGPGAGLTAGGLLAATPVFQMEARAVTADAVLLFPIVTALFALERLSRGEAGMATRLALWLSMGVAVLAKGPVGPAVAVVTATAAWSLRRPWRRWEVWGVGAALVLGWAGLGPLALVVPAGYALGHAVRDPAGRRALERLGATWGMPLAAAVVLPWAVAAYLATDGEFFRAGLGRHVVTRSVTALEGHEGVPGFYLVTGGVAAFPWFALLAAALAQLRHVREDPETRFLVAWLVGPLVLFELVRTKLVHYWLPSYPAGALLVTAWLFRPGVRGLPSGWSGAAVTWLIVICGLTLGGAPAAAAAHFGLGDLVRPALAAALPLAAGLLLFVRTAASRVRLGTAGLALGASLHLTVLAGAYLPGLSGAVVERRAARALVAVRAPGDAVVVYGGRVADALVALPLGTAVCRTPACMAGLAARRPLIGLASARDLGELRRGSPGLHVRWLAAVSGLDLVHGRWEGWIVFRIDRSEEVET